MKIQDKMKETIPCLIGKFASRRLHSRIVMTFLLMITFLSISCSETNEIKSTDSDDSTQVAIVRPDQQIRDARITLYNGAVKTTDVQAKYIEKYEKNDSTLAWNLNVYFYNNEGKQISHLTADSGLVREQINYMEVFGHVVVKTEDSVVLYTEQLTHNTQKDLIETDKFVTIIQHGDTIQGYGLEADQRLKNIKIKKNVTGTLQGKDEVLE